MPSRLHHLRITLKNVEPKVQREFVVPSDLRLDRLHVVLQIVMGWAGAHLHEFIVGSQRDGVHYGAAQREDFGFGPRTLNQTRYTLAQIAPHKGSKFLYWYDFGDDWMHEVAVKAVGESTADFEPPFCIKARGACPPEDCGGPWGYEELRKILADPHHPEHEERLGWVGDQFDPAYVDVDAINSDLAEVARPWHAAAKKKKSAKTMA